jgi:hypothetical protein
MEAADTTRLQEQQRAVTDDQRKAADDQRRAGDGSKPVDAEKNTDHKASDQRQP